MRKHAATIALSLILATTAAAAPTNTPAPARKSEQSLIRIIQRYVQRVIRTFDEKPSVPVPFITTTN